MKHLMFIGALLLSATAHAERYIVTSQPQGFADERIEPQKVLSSGSMVVELTDERVKDLSAKGFGLERDERKHVLGAPSELSAGYNGRQAMTWGVVAMSGREAWRAHGSTALGKGVTVCVIDTGVDYTHPDLEGQVVGGVSFVKGTTYKDDNGHGTHVSGTIAAVDNGIGVIGVAPAAKIYAIKVLDKDGSGFDSDVAEGVRACIGHGQIINMSLGGSGSSFELQSAIADAQKAGIIVVAAAGNDGANSIDYPAAYPGVKAVSAIGKDMKLGDFSNYAKGISFAAPGVQVLSTTMGGGYERWNGTSMATPHVAGAYAVMLAAKKSVMKTDDIKLSADRQGRGLPNLLKVIR